MFRPKQFVKNLLITAVPISAGRFFESEIFATTMLAILFFTMASAGIYIANDLLDKALDQAHPIKKFRPIAAGQVNEMSALVISLLLICMSIFLSYRYVNSNFTIILILYLIIQFFYLLKGKHLHTIEIFIVASGFVLRAVSGGIATGILITPWFNVLVATTAIFIVSAKRYSELLRSDGLKSRTVLKMYTSSYLRTIWETALTSSVILYTLWTFNLNDRGFDTYSLLSIIPFYLILLFYAKKTDANHTEAPEEIFYKDKYIFSLSFIWLLIIIYRGITLN